MYLRKALGGLCLLLMFVPMILNQTVEKNRALAYVTPTTTTSISRPPSTIPAITTTTIALLTTTTLKASTSTVVSFSTDVWDVIARCETPPNGNWSYRGHFEGGLQFLPKTWTDYVAADRFYGLVGYPEHAYQASREQQIAVAIRVRDGVKGSSRPFLNAQGWNAWPTCRYKAGV